MTTMGMTIELCEGRAMLRARVREGPAVLNLFCSSLRPGTSCAAYLGGAAHSTQRISCEATQRHASAQHQRHPRQPSGGSATMTRHEHACRRGTLRQSRPEPTERQCG